MSWAQSLILLWRKTQQKNEIRPSPEPHVERVKQSTTNQQNLLIMRKTYYLLSLCFFLLKSQVSDWISAKREEEEKLTLSFLLSWVMSG